MRDPQFAGIGITSSSSNTANRKGVLFETERNSGYYLIRSQEEILMPVKPHGHKHPEVEHRVKALEAKTRKLDKQIRDLQRKLKSHNHPHTHPHTH